MYVTNARVPSIFVLSGEVISLTFFPALIKTWQTFDGNATRKDSPVIHSLNDTEDWGQSTTGDRTVTNYFDVGRRKKTRYVIII